MKFTLTLAMCDPSHYLPLARRADACGWHAAAVPESVFYPEKVSAPYPYSDDGARFWEPSTPFVDPWVAIPAMAAVTERLRFYTNVIKLAIRSPLLVAKTVGSAAVMSNGRVGLGVGLGWIPEEFEWCGTEYATRGGRADEAIEIIRALLRGGRVEYHGRHYDFDRLEMTPAPAEPVPIYVGGLSEAAFRRAARLGDGWISVVSSEQEIRDAVETLGRYREEYGRADEPFEIKVSCSDVFDLDGYRRLADCGVTDLITMPWYFYGGDPNALADRERSIERFAEDVLRRLEDPA